MGGAITRGKGDYPTATNVPTDTETFMDSDGLMKQAVSTTKLEAVLNGVTIAQLQAADVTAGTPTASKAVVLDANGNTITLPTFTDAAMGGTTAGTGITVVHTPGKSVFTLVDHPLTVTDSGANGGHGSFTFFTFPEGHIRVESGLATFTKFSAQGTGSADSGVTDLGVGTTATATDNEILATTEQDICTKIDTTLDGSGDLSGTVNSAINATAAAFNGASTAIICSLNAAITAATISATEIFDVSGTITINWTDMGDT